MWHFANSPCSGDHKESYMKELSYTGYGHKMLKILFLMNHVFFKVAYLAIPSHSGEKMKFLNTIPLESV